MKSQSAEAPTVEDHQAIQKKYVSLAWDLWRSQHEVGFYVWHPIPEEHLRIEVRAFWRGQIEHIHGWSNIIGQIVDTVVAPIKSFFVWVWNNLIRPGVDFIIRGLRGALEWLINGVRWVVDGISGMLGYIWNTLVNIAQATFNVVSSIAGQVAQGLAGLGNVISSGLGWLLGQIAQRIAGVVSWISQGLSQVAGTLSGAVSWIWKSMQGLFSAVAEVLKKIGVWIINAIKTYVVDPLLGLLKPVFEGAKLLVQAIFTFLTGGAVAGSPIEWRGSTIRWLGIITGAASLVLIPLIGAKLLDLLHPIKDPKSGEIIEHAIKFTGVAFLQAAFFATYFDVACAKPVRQELNALFTPEIPGSGDLITFMVREVIVPEEFYMAMALQGFSKYWSGAYWEAHWRLPPTERTRTAFLRRQIPEEAYRKFLIWYDFKPEPRPGIPVSDVDIMLQTQYDWPGRIDTRWLIEWAIIDEAAALELIKAGGMDPTWAPKVLEAYMLNQLREELGKVRTVYQRALREGFLNPVAFAEKLTGIHYAPHVINALRKWAEEELDLDEKLELAKEYEKLAKEGVITPTQLGTELRGIGMTEERITRKQRHIETLLTIAAAKEAAKEKA